MSQVNPTAASPPPTPAFPSSTEEVPVSDPVQRNEAILREDLTIEGVFRSQGKLTLSGTVRGEVYCHSLIITRDGVVTGKIVAQEVAVYGLVEGEIYGNTVDLFASSNVKGDITHHGIGMERGTKYDGTLKFVENPVAAGESQG